MNNLELADKLQKEAEHFSGAQDLVGMLWDGGAALRKLHTENTALRVTEENLLAELEKVRKDADRYQWLRRTRFIWSDFRYISGVCPTGVGLEFGWFPSQNNRPSREDLDAAIDEAMKGKE